MIINSGLSKIPDIYYEQEQVRNKSGTVEVGPTINSCSATFKNVFNGILRNTVNVPCNMDDATTKDYATTVYINDKDVTEIELKWTASFDEPQGTPSRPSIITDYEIGLNSSKTVVTLQNGEYCLRQDNTKAFKLVFVSPNLCFAVCKNVVITSSLRWSKNDLELIN